MKPLDTILLVDDDETTNFLNQRLLNRMGVATTVDVAYNGEEALAYLVETCSSFTPEKPCPSLVLLDIKMPVMDGFEFLEEYEQVYSKLVHKPVILMLSSSASFYDLERLKGYKVVMKHYSKPLAEADVKEIMREYFPENME